jgi:hypothetical protein
MKYSSSLFSKKNNSLIHNKFILYFVLIISLADLFYLSVERDFISIFSFILIGFLFSFFTKNMLIILFLALTLTNILKFGSGITKEGFGIAPTVNNNPSQSNINPAQSNNPAQSINTVNPSDIETTKNTIKKLTNSIVNNYVDLAVSNAAYAHGLQQPQQQNIGIPPQPAPKPLVSVTRGSGNVVIK